MRQTKAEAERGEWPAIRQNIEAMAGNYRAHMAHTGLGWDYRKNMNDAIRLWDKALRDGFVCC